METYNAMRLAVEKELDLVEVSPLAEPPVCRIMNYGSYQYQQEKKERKQKAKTKKVEVKGIRLTLKIGPNDLATRKNQAIKFLHQGDKVKVELILRGRERAHAGRARENIQKFSAELVQETNAYIERDVSQQGGRLSVLVSKK